MIIYCPVGGDIMTIKDRINEYILISSYIKKVKTVKEKIKLKEKLYEKYDNAYYEEERLRYKNSNKKDINDARNTQKRMKKYINKLNKVKTKND